MNSNETYPYWCGRLAACLEMMIGNPTSETYRVLAKETLKEYAELVAEQRLS